MVQPACKNVHLWFEMEHPAHELKNFRAQLVILWIGISAEPICPAVSDAWEKTGLNEDAFCCKCLVSRLDC
jgi:hypothetical protein